MKTEEFKKILENHKNWKQADLHEEEVLVCLDGGPITSMKLKDVLLCNFSDEKLRHYLKNGGFKNGGFKNGI